MKVMSIGGPLSIQVHPNKEQAEAGFEYEEAKGTPRSAPSRNYKDPNHKPETIVALKDGLEARAGVRSSEDTRRLVRSLGARGLIELWKSDEVRESSAAMYGQVIVIADALYLQLLSNVLNSSDATLFHAEFTDDQRWLHAVAQLYPGDKGVLLQLLITTWF